MKEQTQPALAGQVDRHVRPLAEPPCVLGRPDGYYLIGQEGSKDWCLVYLYGHADFGGVRHVAFGPQDGSALISVWDLRHDTTLVPVRITTECIAPTTLADLQG